MYSYGVLAIILGIILLVILIKARISMEK